MDPFDLRQGDRPLILSMPHASVVIPPAIRERLIDEGAALADTDWHIDAVYGFARALDVTILRATSSRVVVDLNRDPSGLSLYPGRATSALCPVETFDGAPLYAEGQVPDAADIAARREAYFDPFHAALRAEIERLRARHGRIAVYDCHSIVSRSPRLFDGELPILNLGTNDGRSCAPELEALVAQLCARSGLSHAVNGRFKGGWITRHYGAPGEGVHALQMELAQRAYCEEPAGPYDPARAALLTAALRAIIDGVLGWFEGS